MKSLELVENEWVSISREFQSCIGTRLSQIEQYWDEHISETELKLVRGYHTDPPSSLESDRRLAEPGFDLGPFITIGRYLEKFQEMVPEMDASHRMEVAESEIPSLLKIVLFPVLEETLSNVRRHSAAKRLRVVIAKRGGYLILTVSDNGRGFDTEKRFSRGESGIGTGLMRIREWVDIFDGMFLLRSAEKSGTTVTISLPM